MSYEVYLDMRNDNTLCTISMLSAMLESQNGDYYSLLTPFVLYSLPHTVDKEIVVGNIVQSMKDFGFVDFPYKLCEKLLERLCRPDVDGKLYVRFENKRGGKKKFFVKTVYDSESFDDRKNNMRRKIDTILTAIQKYFEENFYHRTIPTDEIKNKLTGFFELNGFTVIRSTNDLKLITQDKGSSSFEIAHFILSEYEKKSLVYTDLCEVAKGFLTYKGLYYFLDDKKNHLDSKFQNVTFYLDCSLILDILNYDTTSDYHAITELVRLIRRCGGNVAVFQHTAEEASRLIDAFASKPHARNGFRLDNLASQKLPSDLLFAIANDVPNALKENAKIDTLPTPSFTDETNYKNILGEEDIVDWLSKNRPSHGNSFDALERYRYDAKSLVAIGMCRRDFRPHYIEQAKAIIVTQDPWLNKCLRDLYPEKFKAEVYYSITDTELVSLLWLRDYKNISSLPSDILISNAHAACRVSNEVMDRAMELAAKMERNGAIPSDAALLVSSHTEFKPFIAKRVRNNVSLLSDDEIRAAIDEYISSCANAKIEETRTAVQRQAQDTLDSQAKIHSAETTAMQNKLQQKDDTIAQLQEQLDRRDEQDRLARKAAIQKKYEQAERKAKKASNIIRNILRSIAFLAACCVTIIFAVHCYEAYISGQSWLLYAIVDILSFIAIPAIFVSKKSFLYKLICKLGDCVYTKVYSSSMKAE